MYGAIKRAVLSLSCVSVLCTGMGMGMIYAQRLPMLSDSIAFPKHNVTVREAIMAIEAQTAWTLSYLDTQIPFKKELVLPQRQLSVQRVVTYMLQGEALTYRVQAGNLLLLSNKTRHVILEGYVRSVDTRIPLVGATVYIPAVDKGTLSDLHGHYSIALPWGTHIVQVRYLGYRPRSDTLFLHRDTHRSFDMTLDIRALSPIIVAYDSIEERLSSLHLGHVRLTPSTWSSLPYYLGEEDVLQALVLLPGVNNLLEGSAGGLSVRGGAPNQHGIFLDQVPLRNATHFLGLISVLDPHFVESVNVYKSSFPPIYNNSASSVIAVRQKEGNYERLGGSVGLGLATLRGHLEGPLKKKKSSFFVSGRVSSLLGRNIRSGWSFVDRLLRVSASGSTSDFFDLHTKVSYLGTRHQWYLSGYWGNDRNSLKDFSEERWGNRALALRWRTQLRPSMRLNTYLTYSKYQHISSDIGTNLTYTGESKIDTYGLKSQLSMFLTRVWTLDLGLQAHVIRIRSGDFQKVFTGEDTAPQPQVILNEENGVEANAYVSVGKEFFSRLMAQATLRLNSFFTLGPRTVDQYTAGRPYEARYVEGTTTYANGEGVATHFALEPRFFLNFRVSQNTALKFNYSRAHQHVRQIYNTLIPVPSSVWKLTAPYIPPLRVDQLSIGLFKNYRPYALNMSMELYYRQTANILEYKSSFSPLFERHLENRLVYNRGQAYGGELSFSMRWRAWKGWLNYGLSRVRQRADHPAIADRFEDKDYVLSNYDRTHQVSFGHVYFFSKRLYVSSNFVLATGRPYIQPTGQYTYEGTRIPHFAAGQSVRLPLYHRLDLSLTYTRGALRKKVRVHSAWNFTLYNVYAHRNVHAYLFRQRDDNTRNLYAEPLYLLEGVLPSITYKLIF